MFSRSGSSSGLERREVDRLALAPGRRGGLDRARLDAQAAAGAVLDVDLQRVARAGQADRVERRRPEALRRAVQRALVVELRRG